MAGGTWEYSVATGGRIGLSTGAVIDVEWLYAAILIGVMGGRFQCVRGSGGRDVLAPRARPVTAVTAPPRPAVPQGALASPRRPAKAS